MTNQNLEIDLKELLQLFWREKFLLIGITTIFAVGSVLFALSKPNLFKSEALLFPVSEDSASSGLANSLGGIAALTGINMGGGNSNQKIALETLRSRAFLGEFIEKRGILVELMALKEWDYKTNLITLDPSIYDSSQNVWVREVREGKQPKPSLWEAHKELNDMIEISTTKSSGSILLSISSQSPFLAKQWLEWMIEDLNSWMKDKDISEAKKNIHYLNDKLQSTQLSEMQTVFYQLIEEQTKKLMLAEVQDEYVFKVIDPAVVPEDKDSPNRAIICVLGTFLGVVLSFIVGLFKIVILRKE